LFRKLFRDLPQGFGMMGRSLHLRNLTVRAIREFGMMKTLMLNIVNVKVILLFRRRLLRLPLLWLFQRFDNRVSDLLNQGFCRYFIARTEVSTKGGGPSLSTLGDDVSASPEAPKAGAKDAVKVGDLYTAGIITPSGSDSLR